jgi:hypothetical protein
MKMSSISEKLEQFGAVLLSDENKINAKSMIKWKCSCGNISETRGGYSYNTAKGKCLMCRNMRERKNRLDKLLEISGASVIECDFEHLDYNKSKIIWKCKCEFETEMLVSSFFRCKGICRNCSRKKKPGPRPNKNINYDTFVADLKKEDWSMVDENNIYVNTKTLMNVICNNEHKTKISYGKWRQGHRCRKCRDETQVIYTIKDVRKEFKEKGFQLIDDKYINNKTPMKYICSCGEESEVSLQGLRRKRLGCENCQKRWRNFPWRDIVDYFEDQGCILLIEESEYKNNATPIPFICYCGEQCSLSWKQFRKGIRCPKHTLEKRKTTTQEKYGVDNVFQSEEIKEKSKTTMKKKYGVDHNMKKKEIVEKAKETNIRNHNGIHNLKDEKIRKIAIEAHIRIHGYPPGKSPHIREKMKKTTKEHFGVDYPLESKEIHKKIRKNNLEKYGNENYIQSETGKRQMLDKYGSTCYLQSDIGKKHILAKYGVEYAIQNPIIFEKAKRSMFARKNYTMPSGNTVNVQGYEPFALDWIINECGIKEDDICVDSLEIPTVWYTDQDGRQRRYFPDIYIKSEDMLIEVKSEYTFHLEYRKNIKKFQAASKLHGFLLVIFDSKGNLVDHQQFYGEVKMVINE